MLWIIVLSALLIVAIAYEIVYAKTGIYDDVWDILHYTSVTIIVICGIILLCLGITVYFANVENSWFNVYEYAQIEAQIERFEADFARLANGECVIDYNKDLAAFKARFSMSLQYKNSLWLNWFTSKAWVDFADRAAALQYFTP